jgi:hypothetical protein
MFGFLGAIVNEKKGVRDKGAIEEKEKEATSDRIIFGAGENITLLENTWSSPARPSDSSSMKIKTLVRGQTLV